MSRVTALYDALNGPGPDHDYWLARASALRPDVLVDLGCGTGRLTVELARRAAGVVLGVEPDPGMLAVARDREGSELVTWVEGTAAGLAPAHADLVTMTGHVSQVFLEEEEWLGTLATVHRALRPAGHLLFDMRNRLVQGWQHWTPDARRQVESGDGTVEVWHEVTAVRDGRVSFTTTYRHLTTGVRTTEPHAVRFRSELELRTALRATGFRVVDVHGDWDGSPATPRSAELLVLARAAG